MKCKVTFDDGHTEEGIVIDVFGAAPGSHMDCIVVDFMGEAGTYTFQQVEGKWYWVSDTDREHPHQIEIEQLACDVSIDHARKEITVCAWCYPKRTFLEKYRGYAAISDYEFNHSICDKHLAEQKAKIGFTYAPSMAEVQKAMEDDKAKRKLWNRQAA